MDSPKSNTIPLKLRLTSSNWWREIEDCSFLLIPAKDILKGLVSSYLSKTIPPSYTRQEIEALKLYDLEYIDIHDSGSVHCVEIALFTPTNPETHRSFLFLRKTYPNGTTSKLQFDSTIP